MTRGADVVARVLADAGLDTLFAMSGNQLMPLFDAFVDTGPRLVHVRHEAAAVHMADAFARMTGGPGVALVPAGPGFANALSALYTARQSDSALLLISALAPLAQTGKGAFQEMRQAEIAGHFTKWSATVNSADDLAVMTQRGLAMACEGRPGPVHLAIPSDVLAAAAPSARIGDAASSEEPPDAADMASLADALRTASRPLILAGPVFGQPGGSFDIAAAERRLEVPIVLMESPRGLADPSAGVVSGLVSEADLIVLAGKRADYGIGFGGPFASTAGFVVVDGDRAMLELAETNLGARLQMALACEPRTVLHALTTRFDRPIDAGDWMRRVREAAAYRPADWREAGDGEAGVHPARIGYAIQPFLDQHPDTVVVCDGGEFGQWVQACLTSRRRIINGPAGAIGGGLPFAIGAKLADPKATVIAFMGDGTAGFHLAEFETAARCGTPFVAVIGNDARWNAEHQIQLRDYGADRLHGCSLTPARYDEAARALGCHGEHVERAAQLDPALRRSLASGRPACINVKLQGRAAPVIQRPGV
ncbi:MAG: thiamine pyrophosphate-binding protein [Pseudomonadota bacterium]